MDASGSFHYVYLTFFFNPPAVKELCVPFLLFLLLFLEADIGVSVVLDPTNSGPREHLPTLDHHR